MTTTTASGTVTLICIDCDTSYQVSKFASGRALRCPPCKKAHLRIYYAERHAKNRREKQLQEQENQMRLLHGTPHDSVKCYNCPCEPTCVQRIARRLWVCCEIPDQRDYERLSNGLSIYDEELLKVSIADMQKEEVVRIA